MMGLMVPFLVRPTGAGSVKSRRALSRPCSEIRTLFTAFAAFPAVRQQAAWARVLRSQHPESTFPKMWEF